MCKEKESNYYCINCGSKTKSLFKKYSKTVLKLTECERCKETADKYVEYDIVIIIIDLILLSPMAYRHVLLNTDFKNFWKLSVVLILLETYCNWALTNRNFDSPCNKVNKTEPSLEDFDMNLEDLKFYVVCLNIALSYLCFVAVIYIFTKIYQHYLQGNSTVQSSFTLIVKTITLASTGLFLQLPSIIWDISLYSYHLHFITLYTCLNQLLAYREKIFIPITSIENEFTFPELKTYNI